MGFFLHRFGVFLPQKGVKKNPKATKEKTTTGEAQLAKTFLKELQCADKEGFFSTPFWVFFLYHLWGFYYTVMGFFIP